MSLKDRLKLNKELTKELSNELGISEDRIPVIVDRLIEHPKFQKELTGRVLKQPWFTDRLAEQLAKDQSVRDGVVNAMSRFFGRRSLLEVGAAGLGAFIGASALAGARTVISDKPTNVGVGDFYFPSAMPYSAIVFIDGNRVIAQDWRGKVIDEGIAGVDDAEVIQSAVDKGGRIFISGGIYRIITQDINAILIENKSNIELIMSKDALFQPPDGFDFNIFKFLNCENIKISGGMFDGRMSTTSNDNDAMRNFIRLSNCKDVTVKDIYAFDVCTGVILLDGVRKATIEGIYVSRWRGSAYPIHLHSYPPGVTGWEDINEDITIKDCHLEGSLDPVDNNACGIAVWGTNRKLTIVDNHILSPGEHGIYIYESSSPYYTEKTVISRNTVEGAYNGIRVYVDPADYSLDIGYLISENTLVDCNRVRIDNANVIFNGNQVYNGAYAYYHVGGHAIIKDNLCINQDYRNISIWYLADPILKNNRATCTSTYSLRIDHCTGLIEEENFVDKPKYITNTTYRKNRSTATFSGDGTTKVFNVASHGLAQNPTDRKKILAWATPQSPDADAAAPVSAYPADLDGDGKYEGLKIVFASAPAAGTNNVVVEWYAMLV